MTTYFYVCKQSRAAAAANDDDNDDDDDDDAIHLKWCSYRYVSILGSACDLDNLA